MVKEGDFMRKVLGFSLLAVVSLSGGRGCHVKSSREPVQPTKETVRRKIEDIAKGRSIALGLQLKAA